MDLDDGNLIKEYLEGDAAAFDELYNRYKKQLYSYLNRLCAGDTTQADDLYQQTWIKAVDNLARYKDQGKFISWLLRIAHNCFISCQRKKKEIVPVYDFDQPDLFTPAKSLSNNELYLCFESAMAKLPEDQREVFSLRQDEVSFKEIAMIQEVSINTVLGRMRYATDNLRKFLKELI